MEEFPGVSEAEGGPGGKAATEGVCKEAPRLMGH